MGTKKRTILVKKRWQRYSNPGVVLAFVLMLIVSTGSKAQSDSLILNNSDVMVGTIQEMKRNVLTISTPYSKENFKIAWNEVSEVHTNRLYTVTFSDRTLMATAKIYTVEAGVLKVENAFISRDDPMSTIVNFRPVRQSFWSKLSASVSVGYSLTKANNLQQYNGSINLGYKSNHWTFGAAYRQVNSSQDNISDVRRVEASLEGDYSFESGIFFRAGLNFLSNSEQRLRLRTIGNLGAGYYLIRRNTWDWNVFVGLAVNNEEYESNAEVEENPDRSSLESVFGTSLDLFDVGDFKLSTRFNWYPSYTEGDRNRIDYRFDVSYDLPLNFSLIGGITLNYDSDPIPGASETDYVLVTGFGWEL